MKSWRLYYFVMAGQRILKTEFAGEWGNPKHDLEYVKQLADSSFKKGFILEMVMVFPSKNFKQMGRAILFGEEKKV